MTNRWVIAGAAAAMLLAVSKPIHGVQPGPISCFTGATVLSRPDRPDRPNARIMVRDGLVWPGIVDAAEASPTCATDVDVKGKFVVPGFISAHTHISDINGAAPRAYTLENVQRQLALFARYGITGVWSLGGEQAPAFRVRDAQDSTPGLDRARLYLSGTIVTARTEAEARQQVASVAMTGPDIIKIRVDDNLGTAAKMPPEAWRAVIDEAHKRDLRVAAHIFYLDDAKALLRAGVDVIAHSVRDKDIDEEFISLMKARNVAYCPTLTRELATFVYETTPAFFDDPFFLREADPAMIAQLKEPARQQAMRSSTSAQKYKAALPIAERNVKKAAEAGLLVVMGTDSGAFPERFQGYFEHLEMEMMVKAGLTPRQVLKSATSDAAKAMQLDYRGGIGTLIVGSRADFVVLDKDPRLDIRNTRSISAVYVGGKLVRR